MNLAPEFFNIFFTDSLSSAVTRSIIATALTFDQNHSSVRFESEVKITRRLLRKRRLRLTRRWRSFQHMINLQNIFAAGVMRMFFSLYRIHHIMDHDRTDI